MLPRSMIWHMGATSARNSSRRLSGAVSTHTLSKWKSGSPSGCPTRTPRASNRAMAPRSSRFTMPCGVSHQMRSASSKYISTRHRRPISRIFRLVSRSKPTWRMIFPSSWIYWPQEHTSPSKSMSISCGSMASLGRPVLMTQWCPAWRSRRTAVTAEGGMVPSRSMTVPSMSKKIMLIFRFSPCIFSHSLYGNFPRKGIRIMHKCAAPADGSFSRACNGRRPLLQ